MRYRIRTLLILAMVVASAIAAAACNLESRWFADLTGWHGGGGIIVEVFSRKLAAVLVLIPLILAAADLYVAATYPGDKRHKWFWVVWLLGYAMSLAFCNSALRFAQSAS